MANDYKTYRDRMQRQCSFHSPDKAWAAIEKHSNPQAVYEKLLRGIDAMASADQNEYNKCSNTEDYKKFIQSRCNFENPGKVWDCLNTHPQSNDLYRVLAETMANRRR